MKHNHFLKLFTLLISTSFLCPSTLGAIETCPKDCPREIEKPCENLDALCAEQDQTPVSLQETLERTYMQNATLDAARASLRAQDENVAIANGDWRPSIGVEGFQVYSQTNPIGGRRIGNRRRVHDHNTGYTAQISQNIYKGGRTDAAIGEAESNVFSQKAGLFSTEQTVLFNAVTAHAAVIANQDIVKYLQDSVSFYKTLLEHTQARFEVGEVGRTDVETALSKYEGAKGDLSTAIGQLEAAKAAYFQTVACPPENLEPANIILPLPETYEDVLCVAKDNNPQIKEARYALEAALYNVDVQMAGLLPTLDVSGNVGNNREGGTNFPFGAQKQTSLGARADLEIPIYRHGIPSAQVRQAYQTVAQQKVELVQSQRVVEQDARTAWENLIAARGALKGYMAQVKAGELAVEGATEEMNVGAVSVVDVTVLQTDLVQAQIHLVTAQERLITATYDVLQSMGSLMAATLKLNVQYYDPDEYYEEYKDEWIRFWNVEDMRYVRQEPCGPLCKP